MFQAEHLDRQIKYPDINIVSTQSSFMALTMTFHFITIQRQLWNTHLQKCITAYSFAVSVFTKDPEVPVYTLSYWIILRPRKQRCSREHLLRDVEQKLPCSRKHWKEESAARESLFNIHSITC